MDGGAGCELVGGGAGYTIMGTVFGALERVGFHNVYSMFWPVVKPDFVAIL